MIKTDVSDLTQLGAQTDLPANPNEAVLEKVPNAQKDTNALVRFTVPEFTSLVPADRAAGLRSYGH